MQPYMNRFGAGHVHSDVHY